MNCYELFIIGNFAGITRVIPVLYLLGYKFNAKFENGDCRINCGIVDQDSVNEVERNVSKHINVKTIKTGRGYDIYVSEAT